MGRRQRKGAGEGDGEETNDRNQTEEGGETGIEKTRGKSKGEAKGGRGEKEETVKEGERRNREGIAHAEWVKEPMGNQGDNRTF